MDHEKKHVAVGPIGGTSGSKWDDGMHSSVRQIVLTHGAGIDSIQFEYDKQGSSVWSDKHGGTGGYKTEKVRLGYPDEFLTSIHGYYGALYEGGPICVRSLTFVSNEQTYGPFGVEQGTFFSITKTGEKIVGFFGRAGWFLDAIGAYMRPIPQMNASRAVVYPQQNYAISAAADQHAGYSVIRGSLGKDYDIVLAIKQKENTRSAPPMMKTDYTHASPLTFSRQSSRSDFSDFESKDKVLALPPPSEKKVSEIKDPVAHDTWGGSGGTPFDDGKHTGIRQIILSRNIGIVYIKVLYEDNGKAVWGGRNGGTGGFKYDKIVFDYPYEILTHITGYYGTTMLGPTIIKSLTFHTTKDKYGPFGEEQGTPFTTKAKEGMVVGFYGRKGLFLDAIGVHVNEGKVSPPMRPPSPLHDEVKSVASDHEESLWPTKQIVAKGVPPQEPYKIVKEPAPCGPGPWGGEGGKPWDDSVFTGIKQIFLTQSDAMCSIQIEYDRNGQSIWSVKHGGNSGTSTHRVKLEYPHEVLTCISGYYGPVGHEHLKAIKSLTFYTSRGKYGPFGEEIGTFFTSTKTEGKVVGFHGRSSLYLDAIGVHMQHWLGSNKQSKPTFFKMW